MTNQLTLTPRESLAFLERHHRTERHRHADPTAPQSPASLLGPDRAHRAWPSSSAPWPRSTCRASTARSSTRASPRATPPTSRHGALMLGVTLVQITTSIVATYFAARVAMAVGRDIRGNVFGKVVDFSAQEVTQFGAPTLITRNTNDVQQVQMVAIMGFDHARHDADHDGRRHHHGAAQDVGLSLARRRRGAACSASSSASSSAAWCRCSARCRPSSTASTASCASRSPASASCAPSCARSTRRSASPRPTAS